MAVLVSGASGFLGSRLVARLVADEQEVIALSRRPVPSLFKANPKVHWMVRDIVKDDLNLIGIRDVDAVVHLAGATLGAGQDESLFLQANELTTVRLCQAFADQTECFIFASSQVVYGDARHLGVTEDFPLQHEISAYACSKVNSENWLRWFQKRHGGKYLALRLCGFIEGGGIVDYLIDRALADEPIELYENGKVHRDYLPAEEGVDALMAALKYRGKPGFLPVNIGSGQLISAYELARLVCDELRSSSEIILRTTPSPQGDLVFSIDRAKQLFDFRPGSMTDAVRSYALHRQVSDAKN
jgi:UDP-glucose 4-epimerase